MMTAKAVLELHPTGSLTARPETVGTTEEELRAMERGEVPLERVAALQANMQRAVVALSSNTSGCC